MSNIMVRKSAVCGRSGRVSALIAISFANSLLISTPVFATIDNTVTALGTPPGGPVDSVIAIDSENVDVADSTPDLLVNKTSDVGTVNAAGDPILYSVEVTNNGNVTINTITVSDTLVTLVCPTNGDATITSLAPGASEICTATFITTQADFDLRGANDGGAADNDIDNQADAAGLDPQGGAVNGSDTNEVTLTITPDLTIVKTANLNDEITANGFAEAGETITYTFDITNTGNVTITNSRVDDTTNATNGPVVPGSEAIFNDVAPLGDSTDAAANGIWDSIAPGDTVRFTATYTVTQQDVDTLQ